MKYYTNRVLLLFGGLPPTQYPVMGGGGAEIYKLYNYWIEVAVIKTIALNRKKI